MCGSLALAQLALSAADLFPMLPRLSRKTLMDVPAWTPVLPAAVRLLLLLGGLGLAALLVLAMCLKPDARGFGTHQQITFHPCTSLTWFGVRCPSCGMTTAWSHVVRGQLPSAVAANSGGALLAILAAMLAPWSIACAVRGRWMGGTPAPGAVLLLMVSLMGVTLLDWSVRLLMGR
jgi:hypothetical protein